MQVNQRLYLLLQSSGLQRCSLHLLSNALVINKLTYAVLARMLVNLLPTTKNRIIAISKKAMRRGRTLTTFDIDALKPRSHQQQCRSNIRLCRKNRSTCSIRRCYWDIVASVDGLCWQVRSQTLSAFQVTVCTVFSLLKPLFIHCIHFSLPTTLTNLVRGNIHICFPLFNIRSLKIVIPIVVYINMYNLLLVTSLCVRVSLVFISLCFSLLYISSYCAFYALCFIFHYTYILCVFFAVTVCGCHIEIKGYLLTC